MSVATAEFAVDELKATFAAHPTGATVVAAVVNGVPRGFTVSTFVGVSLEPPLVAISVRHDSATWPVVRQAESIGLSVLSSVQQDVSQALGSRSEDRFRWVDWVRGEEGAVTIEASAARYEAVIEQEVPAGDHTFVLLRVKRHGTAPDRDPLVVHRSRYRRLSA